MRCNLINRRDDPDSEFVEPDIDGVALLDRERAHGRQERLIGPNAARIDHGIDEEQFPFLRQQRPVTDAFTMPCA
jgi:hypothetical protein